jgi:hypothetical protein
MRRSPSLGVVVAAAALAGVAHADRHASTGPYAEVGLGASAFIGKASDDAALGPDAQLRIGRDLWSWLSFGVRVGLGSHEATTPAPPTGQYFQLYDGAAEARLGARFGALALFAEGGAGLAMISTNALARVSLTEPDESFTPVATAGGGGEYQLMNRHYAFGLAGQYAIYPGFEKMQSVGARLYLRYTY